MADFDWDHYPDGRSVYFDKAGEPITFMQWGELRHPGGDPPVSDYARIGSDQIGEVWVSTVWIGMNLGFGPGPPIIFESMVFGGPYDQAQNRYATEAQALAGHERAVADLHEGREPWEGT